MELIIKLLTVFATSALELFAAIPLGFVLKLPPLVIIITTSLGGISGIIIVLALGEKLRDWLYKRYKKNETASENNKNSSIQKIWDKYGIPGLGISTPILLGGPLGAAMGLTFGAAVKPLFIWLSIGIILWSIIFTTGGALGISSIGNLFN